MKNRLYSELLKENEATTNEYKGNKKMEQRKIRVRRNNKNFARAIKSFTCKTNE